jgi:Xaa-Pro aminopeptidase
VSAERYSPDEIAGVQALQRLAYDCAERVAAGLEVGVSEREAAARLGAALREQGAEGFFHTPFAWFGDRAGFYGFREPSWRRPHLHVAFARQFFPSERRLEKGMAGILDVAPIRDGLCADIGYAFSVGPHPELARAMAFLRELRGVVLAEIRKERTMRDVYRVVTDAAGEAGYECAHALYPSRVLGHKIGRIPLRGARAIDVAGFDARTYLYFGRQILSALWNGSRLANTRPAPGLWAIEPHLRRNGIGAKWEEILVVTESDARWLDDDLPHMRAVTPRAAVASG